MIKNKRLALIFSVILGLQVGCASIPANQAAKPARPSVRELVKSSRSWNGENLPAYPEGRPEITILRITIPAGARLETHKHPVINAGLLVRGQLTVRTTEGQTLQLEAGDPIVEVVETWHYGINPGKEPAEIVVFYAGAAGAAITEMAPR